MLLDTGMHGAALQGLEDGLVSSSYANGRTATSSRQRQRPLQNQLTQQRGTGSRTRCPIRAPLATSPAWGTQEPAVTTAQDSMPWLYPGESTVQRTFFFSYAVRYDDGASDLGP
ncbi:uncharacterized protein PITG_11068 [Phytophthora infestans T30-4]|uniref:Uncharacterized protein n=1 Tax=Phytophthora infestans (strain T30-4) TaxID=403677 RepID=D0NG39_PHYIT|nr:uncharacterized protein PITG_11068 [Phytophthora infestans T30-4]EEY57240.1 hypothetical protein PITG_11068 [Phytophthora infestans T30-4]|eukprot:XP_002901850.1 hypothetical protein PITG_11068 [Phytophthora infestans T30-4]